MKTLRKGASGPEVMALQIRLEALGLDPGGIDGSFGPGTERAVRKFQESKGIDVDGVVGEGTAEALDFDPDAEIPSGFPGVSVTAVSKMFSPHTPLNKIRTHLPNVLGALVDAALTDQKMVLMGLSSIHAETESFAPISEKPSKFNTSPGRQPFDLYDNRDNLGNQGSPDGERFKGRGFIQLTGRFNYDKFSKEIGKDLINNPDLANDSSIASALLARFIKDKETPIRQALGGSKRTRWTAKSGRRNASIGLERAFRGGNCLRSQPHGCTLTEAESKSAIPLNRV